MRAARLGSIAPGMISRVHNSILQGIDARSEPGLVDCQDRDRIVGWAHDKVLRIARTIADIDGVEDLQPAHLAEAIQYRRLDRRL